MYLSEVEPTLTIGQATFFFIAASADAQGSPKTQTEITEDEDRFSSALRNNYKRLLPPSRRFPNALGWLTPEVDPEDERRKYLRLSAKGRAVIDGALRTIDAFREVPRGDLD